MVIVVFVQSDVESYRGMSFMVSGRKVIVTGAGNGLGLAIAQRFIDLDAMVLLVDADEIVLARVQEREMPSSHAVPCVADLAKREAVRQVFDTARSAFGRVDTLINNAAWSFHKQMLQVTPDEFDRVVAINFRAPYFLSQEFCRSVTEDPSAFSDPTIVNIGSVNALSGNPNLAAYAGTKGALVSLTRAMAVEMKDVGIRVNCISPGAVKTFVTESLIEAGEIVPEQIFQDLLIRRFATCEEIAELVVYLCSGKSSYVNGANWVIDGGYMAH